MKESISGTTLFMIVIFFVVIFTGYLCFSINKSRAFSVKNSIIRIVERYGKGIADPSVFASNDSFKRDISNELQTVGYSTRGNCGGWIAFNQDGTVSSSGTGVFCILAVTANAAANSYSMNPGSKLHYFKIKTFYHFDIPVFKNMVRLEVEGSTKSMQ